MKVESWMVTGHRDLDIVVAVVGTVGTGEVDMLTIRCRFLLNWRSPLFCVFSREISMGVGRGGLFLSGWIEIVWASRMRIARANVEVSE